MTAAFLYLASKSLRRQLLLQQLGVRFELLLPRDPDAAEALEAFLSGEDPAAYVQRVTRLKLKMAMRQLRVHDLPPAAILCADTTVALGGRVLGKPEDRADAARILSSLSKQTHEVLTSMVLAWGGRQWQRTVCSRVRFAELPSWQLESYLDSGEWQGKAGAYGIQGRAAAFVEHLSGSYSGVMGLGLHEVSTLLAEAGIADAVLAPCAAS